MYLLLSFSILYYMYIEFICRTPIGCYLIQWRGGEPPLVELNLQIFLCGLVFVMLPLFFISTIFKVGFEPGDNSRFIICFAVRWDCGDPLWVYWDRVSFSHRDDKIGLWQREAFGTWRNFNFRTAGLELLMNWAKLSKLVFVNHSNIWK